LLSGRETSPEEGADGFIGSFLILIFRI
jgi:hypothetical protein